MAHLVQLLLPLYDNEGDPIAREHFEHVRRELVERFGGLTAWTRAPAKGLWKNEDGEELARDDIVIYEVMTEHLDRAWWRDFREAQERRFRQQQLVVRTHPIETL